MEKIKRILAWLVVFGYMGIIFYLSHQPSLPVPEKFPHQDKVFHFGAYFILAAFWCEALRARGRNRLLAAIALTSLYGITDEFHQSFVPGRDVSALDWLADTVGAFFGARAWLFFRRGRPMPPTTLLISLLAHIGIFVFFFARAPVQAPIALTAFVDLVETFPQEKISANAGKHAHSPLQAPAARASYNLAPVVKPFMASNAKEISSGGNTRAAEWLSENEYVAFDGRADGKYNEFKRLHRVMDDYLGFPEALKEGGVEGRAEARLVFSNTPKGEFRIFVRAESAYVRVHAVRLFREVLRKEEFLHALRRIDPNTIFFSFSFTRENGASMAMRPVVQRNRLYFSRPQRMALEGKPSLQAEAENKFAVFKSFNLSEVPALSTRSTLEIYAADPAYHVDEFVITSNLET